VNLSFCETVFLSVAHHPAFSELMNDQTYLLEPAAPPSKFYSLSLRVYLWSLLMVNYGLT